MGQRFIPTMHTIRNRSALLLLASLTGLFFTAMAQESAPAPAAAAPIATSGELLQYAEQYDAEIARLESEQGAMAPRLGEQLQSQGRIYQQLKDHTRAVAALKRAYQVKRVNDGLEDMGQVPILQNIIESNIALQDWPAVDQNFDQLLWIYRRNYAEGDQELLSVYEQVGSWKLQSYRDDLLKDQGYQTISAAAFMYSKTIALTEARLGPMDPRLAPLLYGHALASYHAMIEFANRPLDEYTNRQATGTVTYVQQCVPIRLPGGRIATQCYAVPVMNVGTYTRAQDQKDLDVERRFLAARKSLERIVAIHDAHPDVPAATRAEALAHLGDWYLLRGSNNSAMEHYQRAWAMLQSAPEGGQKATALFGEPVALPALRMSLASVDKQVSGAASRFITVTYDVTKSGRVQNARISDAGAEEGTSTRRRALESVRGNKFRPRLENGVAVDTVGAMKRFPVN